jgi:predicted DNA-binding transcriptional regulator AlpA
MLRVSRRTVFRMRQRGELPAPVEVTRSIVRWRMAEVRAYLEGLVVRRPQRRR